MDSLPHDADAGELPSIANLLLGAVYDVTKVLFAALHAQQSPIAHYRRFFIPSRECVWMSDGVLEQIDVFIGHGIDIPFEVKLKSYPAGQTLRDVSASALSIDPVHKSTTHRGAVAVLSLAKNAGGSRLLGEMWVIYPELLANFSL